MYNYAKRAVIMHISSKPPQNYKKIPIPPNFAYFQHSVSVLDVLRVSVPEIG